MDDTAGVHDSILMMKYVPAHIVLATYYLYHLGNYPTTHPPISNTPSPPPPLRLQPLTGCTTYNFRFSASFGIEPSVWRLGVANGNWSIKSRVVPSYVCDIYGLNGHILWIV